MIVLGFFPHPDDESWAAGGLLALAADRGHDVRVLCATRGEAGGDPAVRSAELAAACAVLGCAPPRFLELPDGGMATAAPDAFRAALDRLAPDVVVSFGEDGAYGHHDHVACARWAATHAGDRLLRCAFPPGLFDPVRRALRRTGLVDRTVPLGVAAPDHVVDLATVRERKRAAIAAHRSQHRGGVFLRPGLVEALLDREAYVGCASFI